MEAERVEATAEEDGSLRAAAEVAGGVGAGAAAVEGRAEPGTAGKAAATAAEVAVLAGAAGATDEGAGRRRAGNTMGGAARKVELTVAEVTTEPDAVGGGAVEADSGWVGGNGGACCGGRGAEQQAGMDAEVVQRMPRRDWRKMVCSRASRSSAKRARSCAHAPTRRND